MAIARLTRRFNPTIGTRLPERQRRIYDFLKAHPVGVLSTTDPNGDPHGVVVYFMLEADFTLHILTKTGTRKYDNLKHNPHTMLTVFSAAPQITVQVTGVATEMPGSDVINMVAGAIFGVNAQMSDAGLPPLVKLDAGDYTTFTIQPLQMRMAVYADKEAGGYEDVFESIESFATPD
ncbi:MAG TPA: pyridoxamine 5'-phosphate oxidase family protein [Candidatus Saccharimonadales bacterium]|nr:pyridoxamine 5'-phosphate oxidase family protein [Candidatus Saccharimonadales bacterium]